MKKFFLISFAMTAILLLSGCSEDDDDRTTPLPSFYPSSMTLSNTGTKSTATLTVMYVGDGAVTASSNDTTIATVTPLSASAGIATFTVTGVSEGSTTLDVQIAEGSNMAYSGNHVVSLHVIAYKFVDLGLPSGTKWATCNVGANSPEEIGDYFAWGATEPWYSSRSPMTWKDDKSDGYTWANTPFYTGEGSTYSFSKYTGSDYTTLQPEDDAATVLLGSSWRMPTIDDWNELNNPDYTIWTWEDGTGSSGLLTDSVKGYKVAKASDESVYIFLPAAGCRLGITRFSFGYAGYYWSSSLYTDYVNYGHYFYFYRENHNATSASSRSNGYAMRPVAR